MVDDDIIEISSDDDLNLRPAPKAKKAKKDAPSPRKRAKNTHTAFDPNVDGASPAILPIATSNPSSQLPPSDPPPSTPPSSTPVNALPIARAGSSPLSSPIPPPPRPPKRKRKGVLDIPNDSDDDRSVGNRGALRREGSGLSMPPPPPPFFPDPSPPGPVSDTLVEGSSSTRASDVSEIVKPAKAKGKRKVVDDDDFEDEWPVDPPPKPKPRPRKKQADEDDWQGDDAPKPARKSRKSAADDEDEDEWAGDAPKKRKPRAPPKKKGKKDGAAKQVVEVVIEQRSPKGAGPRQPQVPAEGPSDGPHAQAVAEDELSPLTDPETESRVVPARAVHTPPLPSPKALPTVLRDGDSILNSPRSKSKAKGKKRAIIDSDEEENAEEPPGSPAKKPRREPKKGRKSAPAALEQEKEKDEDEIKEPEGSHRVSQPKSMLTALRADCFYCRRSRGNESPATQR